MKLFNSYLELKLLVEEAIRKFVITGSEYDEIMRVAKKDGKIDARIKELLSKLKKELDNGSLIKIPDLKTVD
jgi:2-hydroxy-3-keto-5-methylthiopentenyl-1-phosphate phosphatase